MPEAKLVEGDVNYNNISKPSDDEMQNEYDYLLAEQMTEGLLTKGLITKDEYERIMAKNRRSFSPFLSKIIP